MTWCLLSEIVPTLHIHNGYHTLMRTTPSSPVYYSRGDLLWGYEHAIKRVEWGGVSLLYTSQKLPGNKAETFPAPPPAS